MTYNSTPGPTAGGRTPEQPGRILRNQDVATLPVLRALLVERNVTRAGESLGLSQPATSAVLARLRRRFGDQLLIRVGRDYELTPLAASLLSRIESATEALERVFGDDFDPATTNRQFSLALSDYTVAILFEELNRILAEEAPGAGLDLRPLTTSSHFDADALIRHTDGVVLPHELVQGYPGRLLLRDRWVCVVAESNTVISSEPTLAELALLPWVSQFTHSDPVSFPALRHLRSNGIEPHVEVVTDSFLSVPFLLAGSNRVAFLQERLARRLAPVAPVRILPSPVDIGPLNLSLRWHPTMSDDPGHRWFRDALGRAAERVA
ncbi:LysR family transcriptional regulator [Streptomyces sp. WI04-05B]|uniref:LysR family transcriptional regulator n=1 Tax=Streptomyces TaxID=1883 RepID=UPI0029A31B36|nr:MULTISPECIES: LysR family transcriptional regulator [unclassified Streptomyces]MDX2548438.1 LysR family transcriptional regulator [Streptomyces sp. WI04-05B]MDX2587421.1 LysR family transcriptional regulator [Streptomyces sp. WI04-05A]